MCFALYLALHHNQTASIKISADGDFFLKEETKYSAAGECWCDH